MPNEKHFNGRCFRPNMEASALSDEEAVLLEEGRQAVSYTHLPSPRDATLSRMPSSA